MQSGFYHVMHTILTCRNINIRRYNIRRYL